jgi:hypothetical protein
MAGLPDTTVLMRGPMRTIAYALHESGKMQAREFLEGEMCPEKDKRAFLRAFEVMSSQGVIRNDERFKVEQSPIYAFKSFQARIPTFQVGTTWFLAYGFIKKRDRWRPEEIQRALRIRADHLEWMKKWGLR